MIVRRVTTDDIVTLARVVDLELEDGDDDENPFTEDTSLKAGRYAMDGNGDVWRREEVVSRVFQEFMDLGPSLNKGRGKR